jgi:hypothetical protein
LEHRKSEHRTESQTANDSLLINKTGTIGADENIEKYYCPQVVNNFNF